MTSRRGPYRGSLVVAVLCLLLAGGLRLHRLADQSLWHDEGNSIAQARRGPAAIAARAGQDIHPPGYYWALAGWRALAGESVLALRAFSALAGTLGVAFVLGSALRLTGLPRDEDAPLYEMDRRRWYASARVARIIAAAGAGLVAALNTFALDYAQETRMYALLALCAAGSVWASVGYAQRPSWRHAAWLGVPNVVGLYTHYAYPLVMLAQGSALVLGQARRFIPRRDLAWRDLWPWVVAQAVACALFLPWLPTALRQLSGWPNTGDTGTSLWGAARAVGNVLTVGWPPSIVGLGWWSAALVVPWLLGAPWRRGARVVWLVLLLPPTVFVLAGLYRPDNLKFLLPSQAALAVLVGVGGAALWRVTPQTRWNLMVVRRIVLASIAAALLFDLFGAFDAFRTDPAYRRDDIRALVAEVAPALDDGGAALVLSAPNQDEVVRYYYRGTGTVLPLPRGLTPDDADTVAGLDNVLAQHDTIVAALWGEAERDPARTVERTLDARAFPYDNRWFGNVRVARYAAPPTRWGLTAYPDVRFGEHVALARWAVDDASPRAGGWVRVALTWQTLAAPPEDLRVFVQLLNADGTLAVGRDAPVAEGWHSAPTWAVGEIVTDHHALPIPIAAQDGVHYTLIIGLYTPARGGARLPVTTRRAPPGAPTPAPDAHALWTLVVRPAANAAPPAPLNTEDAPS